METQTVEYKQTWRDDFLKEICGFANAHGIERIQTYCADYGYPAPESRFDGAGIWTIFYNKTNPNTEEKKFGENHRRKHRRRHRRKIICDAWSYCENCVAESECNGAINLKGGWNCP